MIGNITRDGGTPSVESIATHLSSMHTAERAPALLALQQTHGNLYVQRVVTGIQAKLKVGQPGDIYEQEADRVADAVMRMPEPRLQRQLESEEEEEEDILQNKTLDNTTPEVTHDLESHIHALQGGGKPLSEHVRAFFEPRFGHDFSWVHTDAQSAETSQAINARAFTLEQDVAFGAGEYAPETVAGERLLAHELTHAVQQQGSRVQRRLTVSQPGDRHEEEADRIARAVMVRLQRQQDEEQTKEDWQIQTKTQDSATRGLERISATDQLVQPVVALASQGEVKPEVEHAIQRARGGGQALDSKLCIQMESAFGTDFSGVRVHTDSEADALNRALNAHAFTTGQDIFFRAGEYNPGGSAGRELLAHELTHVVQQRRRMEPVRGERSLSHVGGIYEQEADAFAKVVTSGDTKPDSKRGLHQPLPDVLTSATELPLIQRRQRRVYFVTDRPREADSIATVDSAYLNQDLTTRAYLAETRGLAERRNVSLTGRASKEAPRSLGEEEQREYNGQLSRRRAIAVRNYLQDTANPPVIRSMEALGDLGAESNIAIWRRVDIDIQEEGEEGRVQRAGCSHPPGLNLSTVTAPPIGELGDPVEFSSAFSDIFSTTRTGKRIDHRPVLNERHSFVSQYGPSCECVDVASYRIEIYDIEYNPWEWVHIHMSARRVCCSTDPGTEVNQACRGIPGGFSFERPPWEHGEGFLFDPSTTSDRDLLMDVGAAASMLQLVIAVATAIPGVPP